ncbi:MFS transporter [Salinimicrobium sediminilitoris]|uniref:MFS transporter n=1 Tax=Salinimicrobium sediminilitoris TaxID=2876715 RepID=UPI001E293A62|nr:MFS transporter [Salinimicrobium sediminilitoris]MCC8359085.1 MFS transporter [Salinimicrobium sediminilitoris]
MPKSRRVLPVIVFAQFCCTSLWFAGNGVMDDLRRTFDLDLSALAHLTSAVQLGFIAGTLIFAFLSIADRFSPSKVFFYSAIFGALFNLGMLWENNSAGGLLALRFLTGFSLAGIYPVGMKIASDYYKNGLGTALGFLVGALVVGTAFPHLLKALTGNEALPWKLVLYITSALAAVGGTIILLMVPDGPYRRPMLIRNFSAFISVFKLKDFRAAAFGYFGHMWELYAFWAFVPIILAMYEQRHPHLSMNISLMSFIIIGCGGISCVAGGYISRRFGSKRTAATALFLSGLCCLLSPLFILQASVEILLIFLIFWGLAVVADSPLFSTLVAKNAPEEARGTALTIVNSIGFAITIFSIQLLNSLASEIHPAYLYLFLAPGPIAGLLLFFRTK